MRTLRIFALGGPFAGAMLTAAPAFAQDGGGGSGPNPIVLIAAAAAGVGAFLLLIILLGSVTGRRDATLKSRLGSYATDTGGSSGVLGRFRFLRRAANKAESAAADRGRLQAIETALEQANIPIRPGEAILGAFGLSIIGGLVIGALTASFIWGLVAGVGLILIAAGSINTVAKRERKKFENQLPDTLTLISTSLRAGYSLLQAIEAVAQESPDPTAREFGRAISEIRLGRAVTDALSDVAERMESRDFEWAVLAISIQREVGGNLAEVLQTTAETMLQRNRLRREMKALTAEGRISAIVLSLLPIGLFAIIFAVNPGYIEPLTSTTIGWVMIGGSLTMLAIGMVWLQKIVKVEV